MSSPGERTLTYSRNLEDPSLPLWREFAVATVHSAIDSPYAGVKQIVEQSTSWQLPGIHLVDDPKPAEFGTSNWYAQIFGGALGMIVPFTFVSCGVRGVHHLGEKMLHKEVTSLGAKLAATSTTKRLVTPIAHAAASGFVFDFAMRPVSTEEGNFWTARLRNGFCGAATFATLAGVTVGLQELSKLRLAGTPWLVHSTVRDAGRHVTAGLVAGSLDAQTRSLLSGHGFAGLEETCQSAVGLAVVGGRLRCHQEVFAKCSAPLEDCRHFRAG